MNRIYAVMLFALSLVCGVAFYVCFIKKPIDYIEQPVQLKKTIIIKDEEDDGTIDSSDYDHEEEHVDFD